MAEIQLSRYCNNETADIIARNSVIAIDRNRDFRSFAISSFDIVYFISHAFPAERISAVNIESCNKLNILLKAISIETYKIRMRYADISIRYICIRRGIDTGEITFARRIADNITVLIAVFTEPREFSFTDFAFRGRINPCGK